MLWLPPLSKPSTSVLSILALLESSSFHTILALPNIQKLLNQVQLNPLLLAPVLESSSLSLALPTSLQHTLLLSRLFSSLQQLHEIPTTSAGTASNLDTSPTSVLSESLK
jgi:hypothetical protein